jgi:membrane protein DedA with SNARE-associated domain
MEPILDLFQHFWTDLQHGQLPQIGPWNYVLLGILILWQGPIATLLGGAAAAAGLLQLRLVFMVGVISNLTADILWYTLGRTGNVNRLWQWNPIRKYKHYVQGALAGFDRHASKILLAAKLSFGLVIPTLVAAGLSRVSWRKWFPVVFIGETIWTGALLLLGYFATAAIKQIERGLQIGLLIITFSLAILLIWYLPRYIREQDPFDISTHLQETQDSQVGGSHRNR